MKPQHYPEKPKTIGEHLRKRRAELRLTQAEAGALIGVTEYTAQHWESGKTNPGVRDFPGIIAFLGYDPSPAPTTLPDRLRAYRRHRGWSIKEVAQDFGVDPGTWAAWERGGPVLRRKDMARLARMVGLQRGYLEDRARELNSISSELV